MMKVKGSGRKKGKKNLDISYNCHYDSCKNCKGRNCKHECHVIERERLVNEMKKIHAREGRGTLNCAMIDCEIHLVDYGKLINFKRFSCFSYSENSSGLSGLMMDKENDRMLFHFTAHSNYIMIYPVHNKTYKPESFVDFYETIKERIDSNAKLFTYEKFQKYKKEQELGEK